MGQEAQGIGKVREEGAYLSSALEGFRHQRPMRKTLHQETKHGKIQTYSVSKHNLSLYFLPQGMWTSGMTKLQMFMDSFSEKSLIFPLLDLSIILEVPVMPPILKGLLHHLKAIAVLSQLIAPQTPPYLQFPRVENQGFR